MPRIILENFRQLLGGKRYQANEVPLDANDLSAESALASYAANKAAFDELMSDDGQIKPAWQNFLGHFSILSNDNKQQMALKLRRHVNENGLAHDVYAETDDSAQPWGIDLLPFIISAEEWSWLTSAVTQRARLLNEVMKDIYGPQNLLKSGAIPPRLIYSDPSFLKPCMNLLGDEEPLTFFAIDIARDRYGNWRVIDTHTETTAGIGFAIANRVVHTKVMGDIFEACNIRRESAYFQNILNTLPKMFGTGEKNIAVLTHGLQHGNYFDHAYLSRYLGYRLVEGTDLRVVGGNVYLKTLSGLMPINGIIRCIEGELSDPLLLDPNGFHGPANLIQAVAKNPGLVINAIGSGILENRALSPFIHNLSRTLLGEELLLHEPERIWLGTRANREHIINDDSNALIHTTRELSGRPGVARRGVCLSELTPSRRRAMIREIEMNGERYVAERSQSFSSSPSWGSNGLEPVPFALRLFAMRLGNDFEMLPGGIAMRVEKPETAVALNAPDGDTSDIWVIADDIPPPHRSLLTPQINLDETDRNNANLPSRIADNLFWLGRYAERAEWTMRLMRSALIQTEEERGIVPDIGAIRNTMELLIAKGGGNIALPPEGNEPREIEEIIRILSKSNAGSFGLRATLENILTAARKIRDRLSHEAWDSLISFEKNALWWYEVTPLRRDDTIDLLNEGIKTLAAFAGNNKENMTRNYGWRFLQIGKRLERALDQCEVLETLFARPVQEESQVSRLFFMLKLADSLITYRSRYRFSPDLKLVLDLLITDESNPRALGFQLSEMSNHINALPKSAADPAGTEEQRMIMDLITKVRLANVEDLARLDEEKGRTALRELLEGQVTNLSALSELLSRRYFSLTDEQPMRVHTP